MLMEVYTKLVKCDEAMPVAANEVYFRTWRGRWCFLPAIPLLCGRRGACPGSGRAGAGQPGSSSWRLPARQMADLGTCMRRVARVLWALHVTFQEVLVCYGRKKRICTQAQLEDGRDLAACCLQCIAH